MNDLTNLTTIIRCIDDFEYFCSITSEASLGIKKLSHSFIFNSDKFHGVYSSTEEFKKITNIIKQDIELIGISFKDILKVNNVTYLTSLSNNRLILNTCRPEMAFIGYTLNSITISDGKLKDLEKLSYSSLPAMAISKGYIQDFNGNILRGISGN